MESKILASVRRSAATAPVRESRGRLRHLAAATASVLAIGLLLPSGILTLTSAAAASRPAAAALHNPFVQAVSCATARRCVAVGGYQSGARLLPLAWTWNGKKWHLQRVPMVPGDSGNLGAVSCHSPTACTAVGQGFRTAGKFVSKPLVERWNGRRWAVQRTARPLPANGSILTDVSCTSAAACTAAGYSEFDEDEAGLPLVERWNGRRWAFQRAPGNHGDTLAAVSCASARSCTAVGTSAQGDLRASLLAEHWNGKRWTLQHMPANPPGQFSGLAEVSCPLPAACAAVGTSEDSEGTKGRMLAEHWNGRHWAPQHVDNAAGLPLSRLVGVSCPAPTACATVGTSGDVEPQVALAGWWNGKDWVVQRVASPAGAAGSILESVSCRGARKCMAVGDYQASSLSGGPESARWNGTRWVIAPLPVHFPRAPRR